MDDIGQLFIVVNPLKSKFPPGLSITEKCEQNYEKSHFDSFANLTGNTLLF